MSQFHEYIKDSKGRRICTIIGINDLKPFKASAAKMCPGSQCLTIYELDSNRVMWKSIDFTKFSVVYATKPKEKPMEADKYITEHTSASTMKNTNGISPESLKGKGGKCVHGTNSREKHNLNHELLQKNKNGTIAHAKIADNNKVFIERNIHKEILVSNLATAFCGEKIVQKTNFFRNKDNKPILSSKHNPEYHKVEQLSSIKKIEYDDILEGLIRIIILDPIVGRSDNQQNIAKVFNKSCKLMGYISFDYNTATYNTNSFPGRAVSLPENSPYKKIYEDSSKKLGLGVMEKNKKDSIIFFGLLHIINKIYRSENDSKNLKSIIEKLSLKAAYTNFDLIIDEINIPEEMFKKCPNPKEEIEKLKTSIKNNIKNNQKKFIKFLKNPAILKNIIVDEESEKRSIEIDLLNNFPKDKTKNADSIINWLIEQNITKQAKCIKMINNRKKDIDTSKDPLKSVIDILKDSQQESINITNSIKKYLFNKKVIMSFHRGVSNCAKNIGIKISNKNKNDKIPTTQNNEEDLCADKITTSTLIKAFFKYLCSMIFNLLKFIITSIFKVICAIASGIKFVFSFCSRKKVSAANENDDITQNMEQDSSNDTSSPVVKEEPVSNLSAMHNENDNYKNNTNDNVDNKQENCAA